MDGNDDSVCIRVTLHEGVLQFHSLELEENKIKNKNQLMFEFLIPSD